MPSTRTSEDDLVQPIDEIERFLHIRCQVERIHAQMAQAHNANRPLKDFVVPYQDEPHSSIVNPTIQANNFELKPSLLQIVQQNQFSGNTRKTRICTSPCSCNSLIRLSAMASIPKPFACVYSLSPSEIEPELGCSLCRQIPLRHGMS